MMLGHPADVVYPFLLSGWPAECSCVCVLLIPVCSCSACLLGRLFKLEDGGRVATVSTKLWTVPDATLKKLAPRIERAAAFELVAPRPFHTADWACRPSEFVKHRQCLGGFR